jgi:hypothetical protein
LDIRCRDCGKRISDNTANRCDGLCQTCHDIKKYTEVWGRTMVKPSGNQLGIERVYRDYEGQNSNQYE